MLTNAAQYQESTAYHRAGSPGGGMDWSNQPSPYKAYPGVPTIALPRELVLPRVPARASLAVALDPPATTGPLTLSALANLLFMSYGFTDQTHYGQEVFLYRSVPSAGALYPVEVYLAARGVEGLADGLYHYNISEFSLTALRVGPPPARVPASALILTSRFFRSAWKYRERAFRYCLLDTGHLVENFMIAGPTLGLTPEFRSDFDDEYLTAYLGLDTRREAPLGIILLGPRPDLGRSNGDGLDFGPRVPDSGPVAPHEDVFDLLVEAARLTTGPSSRVLREPLPWPARPETPWPVADWTEFIDSSLVQVLQKRRSHRNFRAKTVTLNDFGRLLSLVPTPDAGRKVNLGMVTNEIQDRADGYYLYSGPGQSLRKHKSGFLGPAMATAAVDQDWLGRANVILALTAPLAWLENQAGARTFRQAYLAAGRIGQRAYLTAEILGWGCCGVGAFYDQEVARLLDLPTGELPLYLLPLGPIKKRTQHGRQED